MFYCTEVMYFYKKTQKDLDNIKCATGFGGTKDDEQYAQYLRI